MKSRTDGRFGFHTICPSYWQMMLTSFGGKVKESLTDETLDYWCATMEDLIDFVKPLPPDDHL
jgi:hypothetical protein